MDYKLIDAHSHLWYRQDTSWNGMNISPLPNGRSMFLGEERQMLPPFMIDGHNTAEVFLSNMDYAQVQAAVVVQEFIDGQQNDYLKTVMTKHPDRFFCFAMANYLGDDFYEEALHLIAVDKFRGMAIPGHRLITDAKHVHLNSPEMMKMFHLMEANDCLLSITLADTVVGHASKRDNTIDQVAELQEVIAECPKLKIARGHLGMANPPVTPPWENTAWRHQVALCRNKNVYMECGGITWLYNSEFYPFPSAIRAIREAADICGWEKLMWGSDYPRTITAITYRMSYDFITKSTEISDKEKRLFLGENAYNLYRFGELPELPYIKNMSE